MQIPLQYEGHRPQSICMLLVKRGGQFRCQCNGNQRREQKQDRPRFLLIAKEADGTACGVYQILAETKKLIGYILKMYVITALVQSETFGTLE